MFSFSKIQPDAYAKLSGGTKYPDITGDVKFYEVHGGTFVVAEVNGLPQGDQFHGFHSHPETQER